MFLKDKIKNRVIKVPKHLYGFLVLVFYCVGLAAGIQVFLRNLIAYLSLPAELEGTPGVWVYFGHSMSMAAGIFLGLVALVWFYRFYFKRD